MTARELTVNVVVMDELHNPLVLEAGSEVPAWASDQVGDHCFEKPEAEGDEKPARKPRQRSSE